MRRDAKEPVPGTHGHLDAVPYEDYLASLLDDTLHENLGIALDKQYILVDFDAAHPEVAGWCAMLDETGETWMQQARRGKHRLFLAPPGFPGTNQKIHATDGTFIGDVKCNGYVVAPESVVAGHTYVRLNTVEPRQAPQALLEWIVAQPSASSTGALEGLGRTRIELGRNDHELASLAGFMRHRGFAESAIATMLLGLIGSGILEQDPEREPYTPRDAARIARSVARKPVGEVAAYEVGHLNIATDRWRDGSVAVIHESIEWWMHGFLPKSELTLLYGDGGVGKSSWASLVAAVVTKTGAVFAHVSNEEPFERFVARAILCGADRKKIVEVPEASDLRFPKDLAALQQGLERHGAEFLYLDAAYDHFEHQERENAAERARRVTRALARLAQQSGITILGSFHENKAGSYLGSVEMRNVARLLLHATREDGQPLRIKIAKTNFIDPGYFLEYERREETWHDPATGDVQMERNDEGELVPVMFHLPGAVTKVPKGTVLASQLAQGPKARVERSHERAEQAQELADEGLTAREIATQLRMSERQVHRYLRTDIMGDM